MAVRELLSLGYAAYGCVEYWTACEWSDRRIEEFSESLRRAGRRGEVFRSSVECRQGDFRDFLAHVSAFLRRLPFSLRIAPRETIATLAELIRGNL